MLGKIHWILSLALLASFARANVQDWEDHWRIRTPTTRTRETINVNCWNVPELHFFSDAACTARIHVPEHSWMYSGSAGTTVRTCNHHGTIEAGKYAPGCAFDDDLQSLWGGRSVTGDHGVKEVWLGVANIDNVRCIKLYQHGGDCRPDSELRVESSINGGATWRPKSVLSWDSSRENKWTTVYQEQRWRVFTPMTLNRANGGGNCWDVPELFFFKDHICSDKLFVDYNDWIYSGQVGAQSNHACSPGGDAQTGLYAPGCAFDNVFHTIWGGRSVDGDYGSKEVWLGVSGHYKDIKCIQVYQVASQCRPAKEVIVQTSVDDGPWIDIITVPIHWSNGGKYITLYQVFPTNMPTTMPSPRPTHDPTHKPTAKPTFMPSRDPTSMPSRSPTRVPTHPPTRTPTRPPTSMPSRAPTRPPTGVPSSPPTSMPTKGCCSTLEFIASGDAGNFPNLLGTYFEAERFNDRQTWVFGAYSLHWVDDTLGWFVGLDLLEGITTGGLAKGDTSQCPSDVSLWKTSVVGITWIPAPTLKVKCVPEIQWRAYTPTTYTREQGLANCWDIAELHFYSDAACSTPIIAPEDDWIYSGSSGTTAKKCTDAQFAPGCALDGDLKTYWGGRSVDGDFGSKEVWLGIGGDYTHVKCVKIFQNDGDCYPASEVKVQTSVRGGPWIEKAVKKWNSSKNGRYITLYQDATSDGGDITIDPSLPDIPGFPTDTGGSSVGDLCKLHPTKAKACNEKCCGKQVGCMWDGSECVTGEPVVDICNMDPEKPKKKCNKKCCKGRRKEGCKFSKELEKGKQCYTFTVHKPKCSVDPKNGEKCGKKCCRKQREKMNCSWNKKKEMCKGEDE